MNTFFMPARCCNALYDEALYRTANKQPCRSDNAFVFVHVMLTETDGHVDEIHLVLRKH